MEYMEAIDHIVSWVPMSPNIMEQLNDRKL